MACGFGCELHASGNVASHAFPDVFGADLDSGIADLLCNMRVCSKINHHERLACACGRAIISNSEAHMIDTIVTWMIYIWVFAR